MPPSARSPEKVPLAAVSVRVCAPSETMPAPSKVTIEVPAVPEMSNVPLSMMSEELEIEPAPFSARTPAASIVVVPVKVLAPLSFSEPDWSSTVPDPEIGTAPAMPPPPKFITSAPLSITLLPAPTRNPGPPAPHCMVAPGSMVTLPPIALAPVITTVPATASADPPPLKAPGIVAEPL